MFRRFLNVESGARIATYAILGERGSGAVELNGPAAHLASVGDLVMVLTYAPLHPEEMARHVPTVVCVEPEGGS